MATKKLPKPVSDDPDAKLCAGFEADIGRWGSPPFRSDDLDAAAGYWMGYPIFAVRTGKHSAARYALIQVHREATLALMAAADGLGMDSRPLWESAIVCEEIIDSEHPLDGMFGTWPDCLGASINTMPPRLQDAIRSGGATFAELSVKLNIKPSTKKEQRSNSFPSSEDAIACCEQFDKAQKAGKPFNEDLYNKIAARLLMKPGTVKVYAGRWRDLKAKQNGNKF